MSLELARRAVSAEGWRWMPGMRPRHLDGLGYIHGEHVPHEDAARNLNQWWLPDLDDPATKGCILALVRAKHDDPTLYCRPVQATWPAGDKQIGRWEVRTYPAQHAVGTGATEAEALIAALEAKREGR